MKIRIQISIILFVFFSLLLFLNNRYPFYHNINGAWSIGYNIVTEINEALEINDTNIIVAKDLEPIKKSRFLADPFFTIINDTLFIFVENQEYKGGANVDLFTKVNDSITYQGTVLDEEFHLSYPQVFSYDNQIFMLPETKRSNNVLLYKAIDFPHQWIIKDTLIKNVQLKDPTLLITENRYILITCDDNLELFMYCSDNLFNNWSECNNYKKKFGNEVRPGGRVIKKDNKFFIPMQNMDKAYGTSITLYEIIISDNYIDIVKIKENFLSPKIGHKYFNSATHHIDLQYIENKYLYFYDGQPLIGKKLNIKRSLLLIYLDIKSILIDYFKYK